MDLGTDAPITVSVGVAVAAGGDLEVPELLEAADAALYRAKRQVATGSCSHEPAAKDAGCQPLLAAAPKAHPL